MPRHAGNYHLIFAKDKMANKRNRLTLRHCADLWSLEELKEMNHSALKALRWAVEKKCKRCKGQGSTAMTGYPFRIDCPKCGGTGR